MNIHPDMMTYDSISDRVKEVHEKLMLQREGEISPAPYFRVLLSGDGFNDDLDPDHLAQPVTTTYYYPGGVEIDGSQGHRRLTFHEARAGLTRDDLDIQRLRSRLSGLTIGSEARKRFDTSPSGAAVKDISDNARAMGVDPLDAAIHMTSMYDLPIAGVEFRKIVTHRSAKPGDSLAILTSFGLVHPVRALRLVKKSIADDEKAETI